MACFEALLQLDYGGLNDSANKKVSVWSATVMAKDREQEHFDFFFNQTSSKSEPTLTNGKAKKDGQTGIYFLEELLDPDRSPEQNGVNTFKKHYPDVHHLLFSGDTGNGYRGYAMLDFFSTVKQRFDYTAELVPLAPGHAWNRTDARIAHMNTFLDALKDITRLFGAKQIADAFYDASNPNPSGRKKRRKLMARSHIGFRTVQFDQEKAAAIKKKIGKQLVTPHLDKGHMGVRGFLYFDFSVVGPDGNIAHPVGYARVREHADPERPNNPTFVYTWRTDLALKMCQPCSDRFGGPVSLSDSNCTKKHCAVDQMRSNSLAAEAAARVQPEGPVAGAPFPREQHREGSDADAEPPVLPQELDQEGNDIDVDPREAQHEDNDRPLPTQAHWKTTIVKRQVRAVFGAVSGGEGWWYYIPENKGDRSKKQRKGWWLYPEPGEADMYYIGGSLKPIQKTKVKGLIEDEAKFDDFPFTRRVFVNEDGKEDEATQRLVTTQTLPKMPPTEQEEDNSDDTEQSSSGNDEQYSGQDDDLPEKPLDAPSSLLAQPPSMVRRASKRLAR